jgi:hypothetical protein
LGPFIKSFIGQQFGKLSICQDCTITMAACAQALTQNQDYITRTMDTADIKADKAVRHVQQQVTKLKQLSSGLSKAGQLPGLLQQLTAATEALELTLADLDRRADAVAAAAAAGGMESHSAAQQAQNCRASTEASSGTNRTGSLRSWLGGRSGSATAQQQPQPQPQQQQQQGSEQHGQEQQQQDKGQQQGKEQIQQQAQQQQRQQQQQQPAQQEEQQARQEKHLQSLQHQQLEQH